MSPRARSGAPTARPQRASQRAATSGEGPPGRGDKKEAASFRVATGGIPASRRALRRQGHQTMRRLLDAAMEAFSTRGYHATRVNDIVDLAETSHGTFYLYFANKEDCMRALISDALDEVGEYYPPLVASGEALSWEGLREWVGHFAARWNRAAPLFRAWTEVTDSDPELAGRARRALRSMSDSLAELVARSPGASDVDPEVAGTALFSMVDRFLSVRRTTGQPVSERHLDDLTTIAYRAFFDATPARRPTRRPALAPTPRALPEAAPSVGSAGRGRRVAR